MPTLLFLYTIFLLQIASLIESYKIQLVDFSPEILKTTYNRENAIQIQLSNINKMLNEIDQYKNENVDLALFPEYGLMAPIIRTKNEASLFAQNLNLLKFPICDHWLFSNSNDIEIMKYRSISEWNYLIVEKLICLAIKTKRYIATGIIESNEKNEIFNSLFVIDRSGKIVSKYRKRHLYGNEPNIFTPGYNDFPEFDTDFGVHFGLMICFDIMFQPRDRFVNETKINSWIVSSWWVNMPPQINALQMQMAYSREFQVDLFVANSGYSWHSSGTGGYSKGNVLGSWYNPSSYPLTKSVIVKQSNSCNVTDILSTHEIKNQFKDSKETIQYIKNKINIPTLNTNIHDSKSNILLKESELDIYILNATISDPKSLNLTFNNHLQAQTIQCDISGSIQLNPDESHIYALYARSGRIWPARIGDICGVIYCGQNLADPKTNCIKVLNQEIMIQNAPLSFEPLKVRAQFNSKVYGAFQLIGLNNMSLPNVSDFSMIQNVQGFDYSLLWNQDASNRIKIASIQILGLKDEN